MPPTATASDRIFAALASRTGLTPADAVATALSDLPGEGGATLADVLEARGWLVGRDRTLLEGLVEAALRAQGGDPRTVLAGLDAPTTWADDDRATGGETLPFAPADDTVPATLDPLGGSFAGPGPTPAASDRFRAVRLHARGGLGEVYVALDAELNREVALKRIQARHADRADHRARFVVEAEVTGSLEHPGIVPVYSLGAGSDGRPYYAMRFIRGESLEDAVAAFHRADAAHGSDPAAAALALRRLLGRVIDACQAIAYAHNRGVIHRDLKPANIMLGPFGETLVVDWGLARARGRGGWAAEAVDDPLVPASAGDRPETQAGSVSGTPAYMSPEQANGEVDRLGPAADVYGLGATLYAVLAGRPPFEGAPAVALLERVRRGDLAPPRGVRPDVPAALEAVCLKAMALRPEDRYPSALALADDLEHWLADEPVSARREPWTTRLARWRRRHGTLVTAAAAVLVVAAAGSALAALAVNAERSVAVAERDRAEGEFRRARRAVDDFFTRVSQDVLLDVPGLQPLRKDLLATAGTYYEAFVRERGGDPTLRAELAKTQDRLGEIAEALGENDEALASYEAAARLCEALVGDEPGDPAHRLALGRALDSLGRFLMHRTGGLPRARRNLERAVGVLEALPGRDPGRAEVLYPLSSAYANLAAVNQSEGHAGAALPLYRKSSAIREALVTADPGRADFRNGLARLLADEARVYRQVGPDSEAIRASARSVEILDGLHRERPEAAAYAFELGVALADLGRFEFDLGDLKAARDHMGRAESLLATLARENPKAAEYRVNLAALGNAQARLDRLEGRADLAAAHVGVARDLFEDLARAHPENVDYRESLSQSWNVTGRIAAAEGRRADALAAFDRAAALMADLPDQAPTYRYNDACNTALGLPFVAADPDRPTAAERAEVEARASRAVEAIRRAAAGGLTNVDIYLRDGDLDPLRARDDFRAFLGKLLDRGFPADPFAY